jgi:electron transport complex protein RnfC
VAIYNAVAKGQPLVSRMVTVTGDGVRQPGNYEVAIGTPVTDLLNAAGGTSAKDYQLIMGGPMMGQVLPRDTVPVIKATNCILVQENIKQAVSKALPCIRCGACANACPMQLLPQQLYWHARGKNAQSLEHYNLFDCIECGCCAVVCPSKIPLVQYFRFAKADTREQKEKARFADQSRLRMQARENRLEKIKQEQEQRKAKRKAERLRKKQQVSNDTSAADKSKASVG